MTSIIRSIVGFITNNRPTLRVPPEVKAAIEAEDLAWSELVEESTTGRGRERVS